MIGARRILGLSFGEDAVVAAEISMKAGRGELVSALRFAPEGGIQRKEAKAIGEELGKRLREKHMSRTAVVGLPARWLMSVRSDVPPSDPRTRAGILRMNAERAVSLSPDQLVFDIADQPPEDQTGPALLIGTTRERLAAVGELLRAAGVQSRAVTSRSAPLAMCGRESQSGLTLCGMSDSIEIVAVADGRIQSLRYVSKSGNSLGVEINALLNEFRAVPHEAVVWGGVELRESCESAGCTVREAPSLPLDGLRETADREEIALGDLAPAATLTHAGIKPDMLPFDFRRSRLELREKPHWRRPAAWAAAVLLAGLIGLGTLLVDQRSVRLENADLERQLDDMAPAIAHAEEIVQGVGATRGWYTRRPPFLDCLTQVTKAFPEDGGIYATGLAVREDMRGVLSGKASNDQLVLALFDSLQHSDALSEVKVLYVRESRAASQEKTFAVSFLYNQAKETP
jgi:hypothetical protein